MTRHIRGYHNICVYSQRGMGGHREGGEEGGTAKYTYTDLRGRRGHCEIYVYTIGDRGGHREGGEEGGEEHISIHT